MCSRNRRLISESPQINEWLFGQLHVFIALQVTILSFILGFAQASGFLSCLCLSSLMIMSSFSGGPARSGGHRPGPGVSAELQASDSRLRHVRSVWRSGLLPQRDDPLPALGQS